MKRLLILTVFILTAALSRAQEAPYLIPRRIFIGDSAILIVPLLPSTGDYGDIIISGDFPCDENIDFRRIVLERRPSGGRLLIEFSAYSTGVLEMPVFEIGGQIFSGLSFTVSSLIGGTNAPVLSGPASSLAMPGSAFLLYGSLSLFILLILFAIWFFLKGRVFLRLLYKKYKRLILFASMKKTEKRLQRALAKDIEKRLILDEISLKFREFLCDFTENNCFSMTASEFENLSSGKFLPQNFNFIPLKDFFRACDEYRFSGASVSSQDILDLLDDLRGFLESFKNAGKLEAAA